jgi:broad specificity phosphatase PhoE
MSIDITLIRHGDTEYNTDKTKLLVPNVPLTITGCQQASKLTGNYHIVIVSTLLRTKMTFEHSHIHGDLVMYDDRIREYRTCVCDFFKDEPIIFETEPQIIQRCTDFYQYLHQAQFHNKKICLITHANWIKYFTKVINQTLPHYPGNCETINLLA